MLKLGRSRFLAPQSLDATIERIETFSSRCNPKHVIVAVTTSDGITGHGQVGSKDPKVASRLMWDHLVPSVLGKSIKDPFSLVETMLLRHGLNYKISLSTVSICLRISVFNQLT